MVATTAHKYNKFYARKYTKFQYTCVNLLLKLVSLVNSCAFVGIIFVILVHLCAFLVPLSHIFQKYMDHIQLLDCICKHRHVQMKKRFRHNKPARLLISERYTDNPSLHRSCPASQRITQQTVGSLPSYQQPYNGPGPVQDITNPVRYFSKIFFNIILPITSTFLR